MLYEWVSYDMLRMLNCDADTKYKPLLDVEAKGKTA